MLNGKKIFRIRNHANKGLIMTLYYIYLQVHRERCCGFFICANMNNF